MDHSHFRLDPPFIEQYVITPQGLTQVLKLSLSIGSDHQHTVRRFKGTRRRTVAPGRIAGRFGRPAAAQVARHQ